MGDRDTCFGPEDIVPMIWFIGIIISVSVSAFGVIRWVFATSFEKTAHVVVRGPETDWNATEAGTRLYIYQDGGEMSYYISDFTLWDESSNNYSVDVGRLTPGEEASGTDDDGNFWVVFLPSEYERAPYKRVELAGLLTVVLCIVAVRIRRKKRE